MARGQDTVTVPLQGGLGNQLFQLAAGFAISRRTGRPVNFSDYWLRNPADGDTHRTLAVRSLLEPHELTSEPASRHGGLLDRLTNRRVIEKASDDDALGRLDRRTRVVAGYFQHLSYVEEAWPELRRRFVESSDPSQRSLVTPAAGRYGAVHFRLGDYVSNPQARSHHGVTSTDYFAAAIRDRSGAAHVDDWVVVSDEPDEASALLRAASLPPGTRVRTSDAGDEWGDLAVLASAQECVISNSSFSWWAAFIGSTTHGTYVTAPRPWFADPTSPEPPFFAPSWHRRERQVMSLE